MLGLFIYLIMILMPLLIPAGVTVVHAVGEFRTARTDRPVRKSSPIVTQHMPAVARA